MFRRLMALALTTCSLPSWGLEVGMSEKELIAEMGEPSGKMGSGERVVFFYEGGGITLENGIVAGLDSNYQKRAEKRAREKAFEEKQLAKGLVLYEGQWMTTLKQAYLEKKKAQESELAQTKNPKATQIQATAFVDRDGPLDLEQLLVPNEINLIDFYADWCGPCRVISPMLEKLASQYPDVNLHKINIVKFGSPVAKQFNLHSIPSIRVYDRNGQMVGSPTHNISIIRARIDQAR